MQRTMNTVVNKIVLDNGDGKTYIDFNSITAVDWKFKMECMNFISM